MMNRSNHILICGEKKVFKGIQEVMNRSHAL